MATLRNYSFRPIGWVPFHRRFTFSQQGIFRDGLSRKDYRTKFGPRRATTRSERIDHRRSMGRKDQGDRGPLRRGRNYRIPDLQLLVRPPLDFLAQVGRANGAESLFGSDRHLLPIWPSYSQSPILTEFRWSPLITKAIARNRDLIHPDIAPPPSARFRVPSRLSFLSGLQLESELSDIAPLKGLLALHIRRGDYEEHCKNLAAWSSKYQGPSFAGFFCGKLRCHALTCVILSSWAGFDSFPEFLDHFDPEHDFDPDTDPSNRTSIYLSHCYPSILQIISRVRTIRHEYEHSPSHPGRKLDRIYILTNGKGEWLDDLERGLADLGGWTGIRTSRDLGKKLNKEERGVGQAVDMAIAQRADVFVGNGVRTVTHCYRE